MGNCYTGINRDKGSVIQLNDEARINMKRSTNNDKASRTEDCSVLISSYSNELNYNVKYKESNAIFPSKKNNMSNPSLSQV